MAEAEGVAQTSKEFTNDEKEGILYINIIRHALMSPYMH